MNPRLLDLCAAAAELPELAAAPHAPPLYLSSVYRCDSPEQAEALLKQELPGFVYARDGHPNAAMLAEKCRALHGAERAAIAASGMSALAAAVLSQLESGDHIVVSSQLYGASLELLTSEAARFQIGSTVVDTCDLTATEAACTERTKLLVVETITNPLLRVSNIPALAEIAHRRGASLLVDNSFASPIVCRPIEWGADFVLESLTKIMNGHSDAVLGLLCGPASAWERVGRALSRWGLASSPLDCWLALRGMSTLALRVEAASSNALRAAEMLMRRREVTGVYYPGLPSHADHALAQKLFGESSCYGSMVTFTLRGGRAAADRFIAARQIPFCPSLGEICTTLSHPASTSHRTLSDESRAALGISGGTIRLSVGIESAEKIEQALTLSLDVAGI